MKKQSGFTLIEIAIVMVIIGLLLGGVMKGQELMTNAKVKSLTADFNIVPAAYYSYVDRFRAVPGDDANAAAHLTGATTCTTAATLGNGVIEGSWTGASAANPSATLESTLFWQHIRLANLMNGPTVLAAAGYGQTNALGGTVGVTGIPASSGVTNQVGTMFICSNGINGDMLTRLDTVLDDGDATTGALVAAANAGGTMLTTAPNASTNYVACLRQ